MRPLVFPVFTAIALLLAAGCSGRSVDSGVVKLSGGWEYFVESLGSEPGLFTQRQTGWKPIPSPQNPPDRVKGAWVVFRTPLPSVLPENATVCIPEFDQCLEAWIGTNRIYSTGTIGNHLSGFDLPFFRLPKGSESHFLILRIYSAVRNLGVYEGIRLGTSGSLTMQIIREDLDKLLLGFVFILMGIGGLFLFIRRIRWQDFLPLIFFALCIGFYTLSRTTLKAIVFGGDGTFWGLLELLSLYFMPIGLLCFTRNILVIRSKFHILNVISWFYYAWALLSIAAAFFYKNLLMDGMFIFQVSLLVSILILTAVIARRAVRGNQEARIYSVGILLFFGLGLYDVINAFHILPDLPYLAHLGTFFFILSLAFILGRRILQLYVNLQDYSKELESKNVTVIEARLEMEKLYEEIEATQKEVIFRLSEVAEARSRETGNHVRRVAGYSAIIGRSYGLVENELERLKLAAPMHDIGKLGIPDAVLNKPGKLTPEEFKLMQTHTIVGYEMMSKSRREIFTAAATVAYQHHEKWDGSGYPRGVSGYEIHIFGRITAVADVFDSLASERVYKKAWPMEEVLAYMQAQRGRHFDPDLVDIFFRNIDALCQMREHYIDS